MATGFETVEKKGDILTKALLQYRENCELLKKDAIDADSFKVSRLSQGLYSQRQKGNYMLRTKVAGGVLSKNSLLPLADLAEKYSDGHIHITTRQNIQLYFVKHDQSADALNALYDAGIIALGAGGNSVRNINACNHAGADIKETLNVAPLVKAISDYFLGQEFTTGLPRKFKISFCGASHLCATALIDDIALVSAGSPNGKGPGFVMYAAGGMGAMPRLARKIEDFIPADKVHRHILALLRMFNRHGTRVNRNRARIKFLMEKIGLEKFIEYYKEELAGIGEMPDFDFDFSKLTADNGRRILVKVSTGDLSSAELRELHAILENHDDVSIRLVKSGDFVLEGVAPDKVDQISKEITDRLDLPATLPGLFPDVSSCNGASTCNEGITNSKALAKELERLMAERGLGLKYRVSVSGCPNACGMHHIADVGLQGSAKRINGVLVPHYQVYLGGTLVGTDIGFSKAITRIPAKQIPSAVTALIDLFEEKKEDSETVRTFVSRTDTALIEELLKPFTQIGDHVTDHENYLDWDATEEFSTEDVGPGECGGAAIEMIDGYFAQARHDLGVAQKSDDVATVLKGAKNVVNASARALLVTYGLDPETDGELFRDFNNKIITRGFVPESFTSVFAPVVADDLDIDKAKDILAKSEDFIEECLAAYTRINAKANVIDEGHDEAKLERLDLTGVKCPFNYIKVKLALEGKASGTRLEVVLDEGSPIRNVPKSLDNDGHKLLSTETLGEQYLLLVEKG